MLSIENVSFGYGESKTITNLSLDVRQGEYLAIVGESGSGKSTLLKLIYGELDVDEGKVSWNQSRILGPKDKLVVGHEFMKYVAQEFDLMPYTTVRENIGAHLSNFFAEQKEKRIKELLEVVELEKFSNTKVKLLSGGQKQRVALAKAIAKKPEVILLDEPFSHIDNFKKQSLRKNLFQFLKSENITCIVATHDKNDVLAFADQMLVLQSGEVLLKGAPRTLFENPCHALVAAFFGDYCVLDGVIYYAHQIKLSEQGPIKARVKHNYFRGTHYMIEAETNSHTIYFNHPSALEEKRTVSLEVTTNL